MSLPNPLLKRIRTQDNIYIYSGKTGRIFLITEAMSDTLEFYGRRSRQEIIWELCKRHTSSALEEGLDIIDDLNQRYGLFSLGVLETRIKQMSEEQAATELSQGIPTICLELTEACNMRCKYCIYSGGYQNERTHGSRHMDWPTAKAAIDLLNARHQGAEGVGPGVGFYGGEPLLRFDFLRRCVGYAKSLEWESPSGVRFNLTTNGTLLTDRAIEFILDNNIAVMISVDGPQSEHDRNRVFPNTQGSFAPVFENIKELHARASEEYRQTCLQFNCVVGPSSDLMKLNEFFTKNGDLFGQLIVTFARPGHKAFFQEAPRDPQRQQRQSEDLFNAYREAHLGVFDPHAVEHRFVKELFERKFLDLYKRHVCTAVQEEVNVTRMCFPGKRRPYVTVDGKLHICERINNRFPIGNVYSGFDIPKITRLWNQFAKLMDTEDCRSCWAVRLCELCFASVGGDGEFLPHLKRSMCDSVRSAWAQTLYEYCRLQELNPTAFDYMKDYKVM